MRRGLLAIISGALIAGGALIVSSTRPEVPADAVGAGQPRTASSGPRHQRFEIVGMVTNTAPFLDAVHLLGSDGFQPVALKVADDAVIVDSNGSSLALAELPRGAQVRARYELHDNYFLARHIDVLQAPQRSGAVPGFVPALP